MRLALAFVGGVALGIALARSLYVRMVWHLLKEPPPNGR